jgi:hypothetical protein
VAFVGRSSVGRRLDRDVQPAAAAVALEARRKAVPPLRHLAEVTAIFVERSSAVEFFCHPPRPKYGNYYPPAPSLDIILQLLSLTRT